MSWLEGLSALFRRTDGAPPPIQGGFVPRGLDIPDHDEALRAPAAWVPPGIVHNERMAPIGDDLWGVSFAIEYCDAHNQKSLRRISLRHLYQSDDGVLYLQSFCHERKAIRSFRFDRILSIVDLDGVVHVPREFFETELHVSIAAVGIARSRPALGTPDKLRSDAPPVMNKPGYAQRQIARDGLRVLAALARADGFMDEAEVGVIAEYVTARAAIAGVMTSDADRRTLLPYLRRQYPSVDVLSECLDRLEHEPDEARHLFLSRAAALMDIDGVKHPAELAMMRDLQARL